MNTKTLEYMIIIAEEKSITQAAERLYLSQPVLSRHLKNIEDELGTPIFERRSHQMTLTEAGIIFINNARAILHVERQMEKRVEQIRQNQTDSLIILTEFYYINFLINRILPKFRKLYPEIQVHISPMTTNQTKDALINGKATMALFTTSHQHNSQFELTPLFSDELVLITPKDFHIHVSDRAEPDWDCLKNQVFYLHSPGSEFRCLEDKWLDAIGVSPVTVLESNFFNHTLGFVYQGQCCAFIPKEMLVKTNRAYIQIYSADIPRRFYQVLAFPKNSSFKGPAKALTQVIIEQYKYFVQYMETDSIH